MKHVHLYIDANVFMHYRLFTEIDWCKLSVADQVTLILCAVTMRELDTQKDEHRLRKMRMRVSRVLAKIDEVVQDGLEGEVRPGVALRLQMDGAGAAVDSHGLDHRSSDDQLLAAALQHRDRLPTDSIAIVHHDRTLKFKARSKGIQTFAPDDNCRLEDALDEQDKEILALHRELKEIKDRSPALALEFEAGDTPNLLRITLAPPFPDLTEGEKDSAIADLKLRYPYLRSPAKDALEHHLIGMLGVLVPRVTDDQRQAYNTRLDEFFSEYREWLDKKPEAETARRRVKRIDLSLVNDGCLPGENVDLYIYFPDWLKVWTHEDLPRVPRGPEPPKRPVARDLLRFADLHHLTSPVATNQLLRNLGPQNVSDAVVVAEASKRAPHVHMSIQELKHGHRVAVKPYLYVVFPSHDAVKGFPVRCMLH